MSNSSEILEADYLVIGAGAMGMAFTDQIVSESAASVLVVDRHHRPGGHWNDAYPFVRLHSASANYGVNSTALGLDSIEQTGLSRGFYEQASAAEICTYFDRVMRTRFLPSGRVQYFPMCNYTGEDGGDSRFVSLAAGTEFRVKVRKKIVDATFTDTEVPSKHPPSYAVAPGMRCIPPNALPDIGNHAERYVVVGAGKTGIDTCLWLLEHGVAAERISWIMPRDSWLLDREHVQPRERFFTQRMGSLALQFELVRQAQSIEHLFALLNEHGCLLRIDERISPSRFRCATVSQAELAALRRINHVVRLGHVKSIDANRIVLDKGSIPTNANTVHVDCSSSGLHSRAPVPVFNEKRITLQPIRTCQQCFSSALIAHLELAYESDAEKNRISRPIPLPIRDVDWLSMMAVNLANQQFWSSTPELRNWIANSRLDPNSGRTVPLDPGEIAIIQRFKDSAGPAAAKLLELLKPTGRETPASDEHPREWVMSV